MIFGRNSFELAVDIASQSATLPAIATCLWCKAAADALCVARSRCVSIVRFVDSKTGAPLGAPWPSIGVASRPENLPLVKAIHDVADQSVGDSSDEARKDDLDTGDGCNVAVIPLVPHAHSIDPVLTLMSFVGGRSALLTVAAIDPSRGISLRVVIAESATSGEEPFSDTDAEALRAAMRRITQRARLAFVSSPGVVTEPLNRRETQVLEALIQGKTIRQIAGEMHRSTHTIHDYLKSMHRKIGVGSRAELIARAAGRCEPQLASESDAAIPVA